MKRSISVPKKLRYIFKERGEYNYSHQCCYRLKKTLLNNWARENQKKITITGMRQEEGGNRKRLSCLTNNGKMFHPLVPIHENWMDWFIEQHPIPLCKLYIIRRLTLNEQAVRVVLSI